MLQVHEKVIVCDKIGTEAGQKYVCHGEFPGEGLVVEGEFDVDVAVCLYPHVVGRSHSLCGQPTFLAESVQEQGMRSARVHKEVVAQAFLF